MSISSKLKSLTNDVSIEGAIIYGVVGYETVALTVNFLAEKKVIPPITDILGPLTHTKYGKIATWLFLGYWWDHFYKNGEAKYLHDLELKEVG